jgi:hypothetical protein
LRESQSERGEAGFVVTAAFIGVEACTFANLVISIFFGGGFGLSPAAGALEAPRGATDGRCFLLVPLPFFACACGMSAASDDASIVVRKIFLRNLDLAFCFIIWFRD